MDVSAATEIANNSNIDLFIYFSLFLPLQFKRKEKAPKIHLSAPNLQNAAQMSRVLFKRSEKGQEKSNFPKKVMGMVLTNPPKRGIFITLISTRTA